MAETKESVKELVKESTSKIVVIKRTNHTFPYRDDENLQLQGYYANTICTFSARPISGTVVGLYTGLSTQEENILLPYIVDIGPVNGNNITQARQLKKEYYGQMRVNVPYNDGLKLQIGLSSSNDLPISDPDNLPINPTDYARWKAMFENNPTVAPNQEVGMSQGHYRAYIEDGTKIKSAADKLQEELDEALTRYVQINNTLAQVRKFIMLMEEKVLPKSIEDMSVLKRRLMLAINKDPAKFNNLFDDKEVENIYLFQLLIGYHVWEIKLGNTVWDKEANEQIAESKKDAVSWLKMEANKNLVATYRKVLMEKMELDKR